MLDIGCIPYRCLRSAAWPLLLHALHAAQATRPAIRCC